MLHLKCHYADVVALRLVLLPLSKDVFDKLFLFGNWAAGALVDDFGKTLTAETFAVGVVLINKTIRTQVDSVALCKAKFSIFKI